MDKLERLEKQYIIEKINILYPINKIIIKHVFCLNKTNYFYHIVNNRVDEYYIVGESNIYNLIVDYKTDLVHLKKNKYDITHFRIFILKDNIYLQINDKKMYFINCLDSYLNEMFLSIYKQTF